MELTIGYSSDDKDATADNVAEAITNLPADDDNFVILAREDQVYIQVAGDASSYHLEYRAGSEAEHYVAAESPTQDQVLRAFDLFLNGSDEYRRVVRWEPMNASAPTPSNPYADVNTGASGCMLLIACVGAMVGTAMALL